MSETEAYWINVRGPGSIVQKIIDGWPGLVDTDDLRSVPPPRLLPLSPTMAAVAEGGEDVIRVGQIDHAPGQGEALLERLLRELPAQLRIDEEDILLIPGFYLDLA